MPDRARVLLVDDREENLVALEAILEPLGHELLRAHSGEEALKQLLLHDVAAILLDVQMPGLDGFETAQLIKQRERTRTVPIIFLTAINTDAANIFRGYSAGAVDYLMKPFDGDVLRSKVSVFVDLHQKTKEVERQASLLRERALDELRAASEERYRDLADAMPQIVWTSDREGNATYYNRRWFDYTGLSAEDAGPAEWALVVHPDDLPPAMAKREETLASGDVFEVEYRFRAADGTYRWHLGRAVPMHGDAGEIDFWIGTATDIHDRRRSEEAQRFLVEAGELLGATLDWRRALSQVIELAVPRLADWAAAHVVGDDGRPEQLAVSHVEQRKVQFLLELQERYPPRPDGATGPARVVATGEAELVPEITDAMLEQAAQDELHLQLVRELGLRSFVCVPILSRERVLGAITLVQAESGTRYDERDLDLAQELARRCATAIENARLYEETERRAQAARALRNIGDGVVLVDREGVVRLWNPAAAAITGVDEDEAVGERIANIIPGWESVRERIPTARGTTTAPLPATVPVELVGRELWISGSAVEFEEGVVYAFRDLTEERAIEQLRADFVATVSHELRTPLAAIYGSAQTIRRPDLKLDDAVRDELLGVIADESDRLATIVNDLLLASHLDSGRLPVQIEKCDPAELSHAVIEAARTHAPEAIDLSVSVPKRAPKVAADPGQLRQVLVNLVDNAVKYSPDGGPVELAVEPEDGKVRFAVRDRGLGIPRGETRRVFEKFYRLDPQMKGGIGGTGLGLYICRELVRRMQGRIWVEPRRGGGSCFFVELPVAGRAPAQRRKPAANAAG